MVLITFLVICHCCHPSDMQETALILSLSQWAKMMPHPKPALIGNLQIWYKILVQITQACCSNPHPFCPFLILSSIIGIEYVASQGTNNSIWGNYLHTVWPLVCFLDAKLRHPSLNVWTVTWKDWHHFVHDNIFINCPNAGIPSLELFNDVQNILANEYEHVHSSFQTETYSMGKCSIHLHAANKISIAHAIWR